MKRVLILAHDFPPFDSVGAFRPYGWYKYLKEFGYFPVVVTRQWVFKENVERTYLAKSEKESAEYQEEDEGLIIRAPFSPHLGNRLLLRYGESKLSLLRRVVTAFFETTQFFLPIGNKRSIYKVARDYLKNEKVDLIIATGEPFVLFKYASILSKKHNVPWIADYRDPWSKAKGEGDNYLSMKYFSVFENKLNKEATIISTVSEIMFHQIRTTEINKFRVIENGYNDWLFETFKDTEQPNDKLTISLAGTIYEHHPIKLFLTSVEELIETHPNIKIQLNFYGVKRAQEINHFLINHCPKLNKNTLFISRLPNATVLEQLSKSNLLLLFNAYATTGTKIFEYLALKRTILFCFSNDPEAERLYEEHYPIKLRPEDNKRLQQEIIKKTNSGIIVKDRHHLKETLLNLHNEFKTNGFVSCNSHDIEEYSRKQQVQKLAEIIKSIV